MSADLSQSLVPKSILEIKGFMSLEEMECLAFMASKIKSGLCAVEIGAYCGRSTLALAYGSSHGKSVPVYTIDPHGEFTGPLGASYGPLDRVAFFENLAKFPEFAQVVRPISLTSEEAALAWRVHERKIDLLLIDGNHDDAEIDLAEWEPYLESGAAVVFDDREYPAVRVAILKAITLGEYEDQGTVGKLHILRKQHPKVWGL